MRRYHHEDSHDVPENARSRWLLAARPEKREPTLGRRTDAAVYKLRPAYLHFWRLHERDVLDVGEPLGVSDSLPNFLALQPLDMHPANWRIRLALDQLRSESLLLDIRRMRGSRVPEYAGQREPLL